jgi:hypothetical protein
MPVSRNPNFFPYANAQFCRPNWAPSAFVQKEAGALLNAQAQRRLKSQLRMDALVDSAQKGDDLNQAAARRQAGNNPQRECGCAAPPTGQMRYVLQPNLGPNPPRPQRPGGGLFESIGSAWNSGSDYLMQQGGQALCSALGATGLMEPLQEYIDTNEAAWGAPTAAGDDGGQFLRNLVYGGQHYFFVELVDTCDLGPALRNFAAAERDRMAVAEAVMIVAGLVGGIPSAGVSVALCSTLATVFGSSKEIYAAGAQGKFPSLQSVWNLINVTGRAEEVMNSQLVTDLPQSIKDAINAPTVEQGLEGAEQFLTSTAETEGELQEIELAMLQLGAYVKPGSVSTSGTPVQPSPFYDAFTVVPPPPFPMIVRPDIVPRPEENSGETDAPPPEPTPEPSGIFPLVGLGLLIDMVL